VLVAVIIKPLDRTIVSRQAFNDCSSLAAESVYVSTTSFGKGGRESIEWGQFIVVGYGGEGGATHTLQFCEKIGQKLVKNRKNLRRIKKILF